MTRTFLGCCLALLLWPGMGWGAGTHVQACEGSSAASQNTQSCTMTLTAGNGVAIWVSQANGANTITSIADGVNTYTTPAGCADSGPRGLRYSLNVAGGITTFTVTHSAASFGFIVVHEFSGANTFNVCAGINAQASPGIGTDAITSTAATTANNAYVFGAMSDDSSLSNTYAAGTNFIIRLSPDASGFKGVTESWNQTTGASTAATFTQTTNRATRAAMMSFIQSGASSCHMALLGVGC